MLDPTEAPYFRPIGESLSVRTALTVDDVERIAQFNGLIHGPGIVSMTRNLFLKHPNTSGRDLIYVDDSRSGQVVSSLCLIPWRLRYAGVEFTSGEMGIVGTLESYRRQGLIREQVKFFKQRLRERSCVMSHIQGIAYYYRQFGYAYAMPLDGGIRYTARDLPAQQAGPYTFRLAGMEDLRMLEDLCNAASRELVIHSVRDSTVWKYLATHAPGTEMESQVWLIQTDAEGTLGYVRLPTHHFGEELTVSEASLFSFDMAMASLHFLADMAHKRNTPGVRLCLPANHTLMRVARSLGAHDLGTYAWQVHIPDISAILLAFAPALNQRVAASPFAGLTRELAIGFYKQRVILSFEDGKLISVGDGRLGGATVANIPPEAFTPFVLGYRSLEQIQLSYPDAGVSPAYRMLLEVLFPQVQSFLYTIY